MDAYRCDQFIFDCLNGSRDHLDPTGPSSRNHGDLQQKTNQKDVSGSHPPSEDGTRLRLTCLENGELHRTFLKEWVGMTPSQFKIHWQKKVFTGKGRMPAKFKNNTHQQSFVSQLQSHWYKPTRSSASIRTGPVYFDPKTSRYIRAKRS